MSITLHPKYGVNPSVVEYLCICCGKTIEGKSGIILPGAKVKQFKKAGLASGDGEMNRTIHMWGDEPCNTCKGYMEQGVILVSVKDEDLGSKNPYRTGGWVVVKEEMIKGVVEPPELAESICEKRFSFVPDKAWDLLGLPREV